MLLGPPSGAADRAPERWRRRRAGPPAPKDGYGSDDTAGGLRVDPGEGVEAGNPTACALTDDDGREHRRVG